MSLIYQIKNYEIDNEDSSKTKVGFYVSDKQGNKLAVDRSVTTGNKSKEEIVKEASELAKDSIDKWQSEYEVVGKVWDPNTNSIK